MKTGFSEKIFKIDQKLIISGFLSHEEYINAPLISSVDEWIETRSKTIKRDIIYALIADEFKLKKLDESKGELLGHWHDGAFYCYKTKLCYKTVITEETIGTSIGLITLSNERAFAEPVSNAFINALMKFEADKNATITCVKTNGHKLAYYVGEICAHEDEEMWGLGKNEIAKKETFLVESAVKSLWRDLPMISRCDSATMPLVIISGSYTNSEFVNETLSERKAKVFEYKNISSLISEMNVEKKPDEFINSLNEMHIRVAVPKLCPFCKKSHPTPAMAQLHLAFSIPKGNYYHRGEGCSHCYEGYCGVAHITERVDSENKNQFIETITDYINERRKNSDTNIFQIYTSSQKTEYQTLYKSLSKSLVQGEISPLDVKKLFF